MSIKPLPDISVVIPTYQSGHFLPDALESIRIQKLSNDRSIEVIVVDGGSTDSTKAICKNYRDIITVFLSENDTGQANAINKGFSLSSGEIMAWLCADDTYESGCFEFIIEEFERCSADIIYGDLQWRDILLNPLKIQKEVQFDLRGYLSDYNYIPQPATFWRRNVWERVGGVREDLDFAFDRDLWLRFLLEGAELSHVRRVLASMRLHDQQKTSLYSVQSSAEDSRVVNSHMRINGIKVSRAEAIARKSIRVSRRLLRGGYGSKVWSRFRSEMK